MPIVREKLQLQIDKVEKDEVVEGSLFCQDSHIFGIHAGVADFGSEEKDGINAWSDYLKSIDMDELDKEIENSKSAKEKKEQLKLLEVDTVIESIYENADNKLDLLPYPGEWYAYRIYAGKKELLKNPQIDVNSRLKSI